MRYLTALLIPLLLATPPLHAGESLLKREEVRQFIDEMVAKHDFQKPELANLFAEIRLQPSIIEAITRPAEAKPWYQYRPIFLKEGRIQGGVEYWRKNAETLARAEQEFGVPPEIITAIVGVETRYGRHAGGYRVPDALATLAFDYPKRGKFFRSELVHYLLLTREEGIDPLSLKGSYAGAMGHPQFIASSYRNYAIDFDGDHKRDLWNNSSDVIGSVANYFSRHGWERGEPIVARATLSGEAYRPLLDQGLKPQLSLQRLAGYGVTPAEALPEAKLATLLQYEVAEGRHEYWVGLNNFYVITRYNHSPLYAMAVYQLSQEIKARYEETRRHASR